MDSKHHGRFVYRELFLSIDIFFAPVGDINCHAEGNSFLDLLLTLVFIHTFEVINSDKSP